MRTLMPISALIFVFLQYSFVAMPAGASEAIRVHDSYATSSGEVEVEAIRQCAPLGQPQEHFLDAGPDGQMGLRALNPEGTVLLYRGALRVLANPISCPLKEEINDRLTVTSIVFGAVTAATACTGVAAPVSAVLGFATVGISYLQFKVSKIPCVDPVSEARVRREIKEAVCEAMNGRGRACDPSRL